MAINLTDAVYTVIQDVQNGFPELSFPQAISYALSTLSVDQLDMDDETGPAYELVLTSSPTDLIVEVAAQEDTTLDRGDIVEVDGVATIDGMDAFEWFHLVLSA